jgi:hypothetical protein
MVDEAGISALRRSTSRATQAGFGGQRTGDDCRCWTGHQPRRLGSRGPRSTMAAKTVMASRKPATAVQAADMTQRVE